MIHIVWEFRVQAEKRKEFERHYCARGTWAGFFRRGKGYRETLLLQSRDDAGLYLTVDVWQDLASFEAFKKAFASEYAAIDRRCEALSASERSLGIFQVPE